MYFLIVACDDENFYDYYFSYILLASCKIFKYERIYILSEEEKIHLLEIHKKNFFNFKKIYFKIVNNVDEYIIYFKKNNGFVRRNLLNK